MRTTKTNATATVIKSILKKEIKGVRLTRVATSQKEEKRLRKQGWK